MHSFLKTTKRFIVPIFLFLLIIAFGWFISVQSGLFKDFSTASSISLKSTCVPTPSRPVGANFNAQTATTPTPIISSNNLITVTVFPDNQIIIVNTIDLAKNISDKEKTFVYVMHCNGSIDLFKVKASNNIYNDVPLLPDDSIYDWIPPASLMGSRPIIISKTQTPTVHIPISEGYPPPSTPTVTPTTNSYP